MAALNGGVSLQYYKFFIHSFIIFVFNLTDGSRTLEGSLAFIVATFIPILILNVLSFISLSVVQWLVVAGAVIVSALVEAHTDQIDNLVLPLIFYSIVSFIG